MTEQLKKQREEKIATLQEKYKEEIDSCIDQAKKYAIEHPSAKRCIIRRKSITKEFKIALEESLKKENFAVDFYLFGWMKIWFDELYVAF